MVTDPDIKKDIEAYYEGKRRLAMMECDPETFTEQDVNVSFNQGKLMSKYVTAAPGNWNRCYKVRGQVPFPLFLLLWFLDFLSIQRLLNMLKVSFH